MSVIPPALETTADLAAKIIERCRLLARITDIPGTTTRTFLSPAMRRCMSTVQAWMEAAGMSVSVDAVGNLRGLYPALTPHPPRLIIGSHLDTVPDAGAFDGVLGVMIGLMLVEFLSAKKLSFAIELVCFSEEEGVRFRTPFIGSRALVGRIDEEILARKDENDLSVREAIANFGLPLDRLEDARIDRSAIAFLEFHIEQGPILESIDRSLGVVDAIAGQTRGEIIFIGSANHAGTTPMHLRHDAVVAASHWICQVEDIGRSVENLVATVGKIEVLPGAGNVIAREVRASLDVRHADDAVRINTVKTLVSLAHSIAEQRELQCDWRVQMDQPAIQMDPQLTQLAYDAIRSAGTEPLRMISGAGHDAMVMAERLPTTMIFLRSPGGLSHHPHESVRLNDVENAFAAGLHFLKRLDEAITETHA